MSDEHWALLTADRDVSTGLVNYDLRSLLLKLTHRDSVSTHHDFPCGWQWADRFHVPLGDQREQWGRQSLGGSATPVYLLGCSAEFGLTGSRVRGVSGHCCEHLDVKAALLGILEVRVAPRGKQESLGQKQAWAMLAPSSPLRDAPQVDMHACLTLLTLSDTDSARSSLM